MLPVVVVLREISPTADDFRIVAVVVLGIDASFLVDDTDAVF